MRVTVTGAAGRIGRTLVPGLALAGHRVRGIDVVRADVPWADDLVVADVADDDGALVDVLTGADAVVHLAAIAAETDFETAFDSHVRLTHRVLEQARSSGVGKTAAEALCSLYHDRHGLAVACLRIGSFREHPTTRGHLSSWLSPGDLVRLVDACLRAPDLGFAIVYGISGNTRGWWDLSSARQLGYEPLDDAERWAAEIESVPPTDDDELDGRHVGGDFARPAPSSGR